MKSNLRIINIVFFITCFIAIDIYAQSNTVKNSFYTKLKDYDLANVISPDSIMDDSFEKFKRPEFLGFIGDNYQRFHIHFTSFQKSESDPYIYNVVGKSKVKDNICNFTGTFKIVSALYYTKQDAPEIDVFPDFKEGYITSKVVLFEDKNDKGSGIIHGELTTEVYFDSADKLYYNALWLVADGFSNNGFVGCWTSYTTNTTKKCNWGDFRIPESGSLDYGAGEFSVNSEYRKNGWENYYNSYCCDPNSALTKAAKKNESQKWWE